MAKQKKKKYSPKKDIEKVLNYLWPDEERSYKENPCKGHIFLVLQRLAKNN